jgi:hypothetical protein
LASPTGFGTAFTRQATAGAIAGRPRLSTAAVTGTLVAAATAAAALATTASRRHQYNGCCERRSQRRRESFAQDFVHGSPFSSSISEAR